ncbi:MAG: hypothetical protein OK455_06135 [Thaumarchaeota archaeon]|nr:hypothetical protein [Nitrososphaerota archaeon]
MENAKHASNWKTYGLLALTVGVVAAVTGVFVLGGTSTGSASTTTSSMTSTVSSASSSSSTLSTSTVSGSTAVTTVTSQTLGIALVLSVTPSQGPLSTAFVVNATVTNDLSRANNVTGVDDYHGVQFNPLCNNGPVTFEVLQGYYTDANFTSGTVLSIHGVQNMMCIVPTSALSYYVFQPNSDVFTGPLPQQGGQSAAVTTRAAATSASLEYVYSSSFANPQPFAQGVYTVVGADNWGQLAVVHFTVGA